MNYKGSAFSLGKGRIADSIMRDGCIHFLQDGGSSYMLRAFDPVAKAFSTLDLGASYADLCWFFGDKILELKGKNFTLAEAEEA